MVKTIRNIAITDDNFDSGSSARNGCAGSSPASRTKKASVSAETGAFLYLFLGFLPHFPRIALRNSMIQFEYLLLKLNSKGVRPDHDETFTVTAAVSCNDRADLDA
jgi:hypothetical protein